MTRERNCCVRVVVEDAGKGFDPKALSASMASGERLGLFSIQQRLADAGVRMTLASEPGVGTRVEILALIDCRDRAANRRVEGRAVPEAEQESETEEAFCVLTGNNR